MPDRISYAQNGEDVRLWRAFGPSTPNASRQLTYVDVGANEPRRLSLTASLYDLGWRGLLVEADPELASRLRRERPGDEIVEAAAAEANGTLTFYRVPGTGLGTLDMNEAESARERGYLVMECEVPTRRLDDLLSDFCTRTGRSTLHALSIDVEGAEAQVLGGLTLTTHRPWVICVEGIEPGTSIPSHHAWEPTLLSSGYRFVAFDGINRWYVADECGDLPVLEGAGAAPGTTIAAAIATPMNPVDRGLFGWVGDDHARFIDRDNRSFNRIAWQREFTLHDLANDVPRSEYEKQIHELRTALTRVEGSRTFRFSRVIARLGRRAQHVLNRVSGRLPRRFTHRLVRERHLRHVSVNMGHLTDPAYLGSPPEDSVTWIASDDVAGARPPIPPGLSLEPMTGEVARDVRAWLHAHPFDSDSELDSRMDNHDDEVGRTQAALRTRIRIAVTPSTPHRAAGGRVLIDARALQSPAFGTRGIGRFAASVLLAARDTLGDERITLLIDKGLRPVPVGLAGHCPQVTRVRLHDVQEYGVLLQPSPMTHSPDPLVPLLHSDVHRVAVVYDFIPLHYPTVYLRHVAARAEYAALLDALLMYDEFICISHLVRSEWTEMLRTRGGNARSTRMAVAWPRDVAAQAVHPGRETDISPSGPIVLMTGDEPRKNTFGGLAGIAAATSHEDRRNVIVVGMAGQDVRVHHWSIAAAMRPGEVTTIGRIDDAQLTDLLASACCVVVPSFDEGLSLPVIEALSAGVPVVASDIPAHRELIGSGAFSCDPSSPRSIARAVQRTRARGAVQRRQQRSLRGHSHDSIEEVIHSILTPRETSTSTPTPHPEIPNPGTRLSIGVATPWDPQRTGVADFSTTVFTELARMVDLTVYSTSGAEAPAPADPTVRIEHRPFTELLDNPDEVASRHDVLLAVVGNSHYHLPIVEALSAINAVVVAHDTRMVEFYMSLRGQGGVEQLMLTTADPEAPTNITPALDEQIDDMRLLQNAGFWEIANRSNSLVLHSPTASPRILRETGKQPIRLPFATQRVPKQSVLTETDRHEARRRRGLDHFPEGTIHLGSFGYVDARTKMTDVVVETAAWLTRWGHSVALHLIGSASPDQEREFAEQARSAGIHHFGITGFLSDTEFRDWLLAIDVGVQLRVSPLLGVSGPLSDLAAFGTPAVASRGLCVDVGTPDYVYRLPDDVSPLMVAEAVEGLVQHPMPFEVREEQRQAYVVEKSPRHYADRLLEMIRP